MVRLSFEVIRKLSKLGKNFQSQTRLGMNERGEAIASELKQLALMRLEQSEAELEDDLSWVRGEGTLSAAGEQEPSGVARGGVLRGVRRAGWRP